MDRTGLQSYWLGLEPWHLTVGMDDKQARLPDNSEVPRQESPGAVEWERGKAHVRREGEGFVLDVLSLRWLRAMRRGISGRHWLSARGARELEGAWLVSSTLQ